jgi:hypothetical protein
LLKFKTAMLLGALLFLGSNELEAVTLPGVPAAAEEPAKPEPLVQGGLLGAISSSIDDVQDKLDLNENLVDAWRLRADRAADEVDKLVNQPSSRSPMSVVGDFLLLSGVWLGVFALLTVLGGLLDRRLSEGRFFRKHQRSQDLLGYLLPYTIPAMICLPLTLYVSHFLPNSVGRALALCFAYATSSGIFSTSMFLCVIVMFNTGHKRRAVQIIRDYCPKPLFLIGFLAALSDALTSPQIARQLGGNITSSIAVFTGLFASIIFGLLVIRLRRPVADATLETAVIAGVPADLFRALVLADSTDGDGLGDQPDRRRRGQSESAALRVVHHDFADRHGVPQYDFPAPVQVSKRPGAPAQQRLQGTLSQFAACAVADRHGGGVHRNPRADLGRVAVRVRRTQLGRPGDQ